MPKTSPLARSKAIQRQIDALYLKQYAIADQVKVDGVLAALAYLKGCSAILSVESINALCFNGEITLTDEQYTGFWRAAGAEAGKDLTAKVKVGTTGDYTLGFSSHGLPDLGFHLAYPDKGWTYLPAAVGLLNKYRIATDLQPLIDTLTYQQTEVADLASAISIFNGPYKAP